MHEHSFRARTPTASISQLLTTKTTTSTSHQPVDIHNVYNQVQVKLLSRLDDMKDVPLYSEVFSDGDNQVEVRLFTICHTACFSKPYHYL